MKNKAFTLIELLVVILIIAVLAAIALPQYNRADLKLKFKELKVHLHEIKNAEKRYFLEAGSYAHDRNNLDIEFPLSKDLSDPSKIKISKNMQCGIEGVTNARGYKNIYCLLIKQRIYLFYMFSSSSYMCCNYNLTNSYNDEFCKKEMNNTAQSQFSNSSRRCYDEKH